jgi:hypothetical protein
VLPEAGQERIPGGVTEGVVVRLEAIEVVEQDQKLALRAGGPESPLQVGDESASVRKARELVMQRLVGELRLGPLPLHHPSELRSDVGHQLEQLFVRLSYLGREELEYGNDFSGYEHGKRESGFEPTLRS